MKSQNKPKPLDLKEMEKNIDCGSEEYWQRWYNARELDMPKIISELLKRRIKTILEAKTEKEKRLMEEGFYQSISLYFEDAVAFGKLLMLRELTKHIKSACEFYLRYKDNPSLLVKEHPEYEKEIKKFEIPKFWNVKVEYNLADYNEWLFKLAFKDVLGGENEKEKG